MTIDTSIGLDDPSVRKQSGIDDEAVARKKDDDKRDDKRDDKHDDGEASMDDDGGRDLTSEDIAAGNDRNVSADQGNRSGRTSKTRDDAIELGK